MAVPPLPLPDESEPPVVCGSRPRALTPICIFASVNLLVGMAMQWNLPRTVRDQAVTMGVALASLVMLYFVSAGYNWARWVLIVRCCFVFLNVFYLAVLPPLVRFHLIFGLFWAVFEIWWFTRPAVKDYFVGIKPRTQGE